MKEIYNKQHKRDYYKTSWNIYPEILRTVNIEKNGRILDAGCGSGELTNFFNYSQIWGLDPSRSSLRIAKKRYQKVFLGKLESMPFRSNEFTTTICIQVIQYVKNYDLAFSEMKRVTSKKIIVSVPNFNWFKIKAMLSLKFRKILLNGANHNNFTNRYFLKNLAKKNNMSLKIYYISNKFSFIRNLFGNFLASEVLGVFEK